MADIQVEAGDRVYLRHAPALCRSRVLSLAVIFAGPLMTRIESTSSNRILADKSLHDFIDAMQTVEMPAQPSPQPKTQNL